MNLTWLAKWISQWKCTETHSKDLRFFISFANMKPHRYMYTARSLVMHEIVLFNFFKDAWSIAETDADVESNAASSRPSSAHHRARPRPATAVSRQVTPAAPIPRPMTAPATDYRSQARPGTSGTSRSKSSASHPRSRGEEERLSQPASSAASSPLAITNGVSCGFIAHMPLTE